MRQSIKAAEAADLTGISHRSLRRYAAQGLFPGAYRVGTHGKWRFGREQLVAWIDSGAQAYHTYLYIGVRLLLLSLSLRELEKEDARLLCSLNLSQLSLMYGLSFEDGFKMGFDEQAGGDKGWVDIRRGILNLRIGCDREKALFGRIPPQTVRLPLLPLAGCIIKCLQSRGLKTLGELYGPNRLDQAYNDLGNFARLDESCRLRLRRLVGRLAILGFTMCRLATWDSGSSFWYGNGPLPRRAGPARSW